MELIVPFWMLLSCQYMYFNGPCFSFDPTCGVEIFIPFCLINEYLISWLLRELLNNVERELDSFWFLGLGFRNIDFKVLMGAKAEMLGCYEMLIGIVKKSTVVSVVMISTMKGSFFFKYGKQKSELLFVKEPMKHEWESIWICDACFWNGDQSLIKWFVPPKSVFGWRLFKMPTGKLLNKFLTWRHHNTVARLDGSSVLHAKRCSLM